MTTFVIFFNRTFRQTCAIMQSFNVEQWLPFWFSISCCHSLVLVLIHVILAYYLMSFDILSRRTISLFVDSALDDLPDFVFDPLNIYV